MWQNFVKKDHLLDELELLSSCLALWVVLQSPLEFVFCLFKLTCRPEDEAPQDPIFNSKGLLVASFPDLANCFDYVSFLELGVGPVPMRIVPVPVVLFGLATHSDCIAVELVHVVDEGQIVVGKRVFGVELNTLFQTDYCLVILLKLEICQGEVVHHLSIRVNL